MSATDPNNFQEKQLYRLIHDVYVFLDCSDRLTLEKFTLTPTQFRLLSLIDSTNGQRLTSLSDRLLRSKSQVTRIVDILENNGLVQRTVDPQDRRAQQVVLTESGRLMRDSINREHLKALEALFSGLKKNELGTLTQALDKLKQGMVTFLGLE